MSVDYAVSGTALHPWCRFLRSRSVRQLLAGALASWTLASGPLFAQQGSGSVQTLQVQPAGLQAFQLDAPTVTGQVDAIHSPNVDHMLKPQYHLEIERRHSQLIITNRKVRRIAVTDSTIANYVQYSETEISIVGMELGKTDLTFWFEGEPSPSIYEVSVVRDASLEEQRTVDFGKLERRLKDLFPNSTVALIPVGVQVLVRGQAYDGEEAQNILQIVRSEVMRTLGRSSYNDDTGALNVFAASGALGGAGGIGNGNNGANNGFRDIVINELSIPGEYNIKMRVLVAEINRSELRNAGIDWRVFFGDGRHVVGSTMGGAIGTTLSGIFENGEIAVFVRWLQSNGTIKLLAEPQIVCISGTAASILAGGEFAVPTIIGLGGGQATSFRGFGTSLVVTPTVMDRDLIRLMVVPEFSELNAANTVNGIPGTNVKRVMTTVELREGQTFAIGGLISRQTGTEVSRIPLLGDIPYIGPRIFQSKNASEVETELLVLVSPEIVRPMEPDEVPPMPGFNSTHPSDHELWHRGQTEGSPNNNVYQVSPFGSGSMHGVPQGYSLYNPPVNHGGYTPPAQGAGAMMNHSGYQGGPAGSFGPEIPYQSGSTLPPTTNYSSPPAHNYPPMQPMAAPPSQYVPPQQYGPSQQYGPQQHVMPQPMPSSQLPPAPQNIPAQGRFTPGQKPSMLSRMSAPFQKNDLPPQNDPGQNSTIRPAGWSRAAQK